MQIPFDLPLIASPLMVFGILLLGGSVGGYLAHRISWLPSITGFMLVGVVLGPQVSGLLSPEALLNASVISDIALCLIMYQLGNTLNVRKLNRRPYVFVASLAESFASFAAVMLVLFWLGFSWGLCGLAAAICVSSSPAVLVHVAHEMGASGTVTETGKTMVAINNVIAFILFSIVLPLSHLGSEQSLWDMVILSGYRLLGSALLGILLGTLLVFLSRLTHSAEQYRFAMIVGSVMLIMGYANLLGLSILFAPLVMGITVRLQDGKKILKKVEFGTGFELFFIALFVLAGANLHLTELWHLAPVVLAVVVARIASKYLAVLLAGVAYKRPSKEYLSTGFLLVPMAGMAIGLTQSFDTLSPNVAASLAAIVLGSVAVFETVGPVLAAYAFRLSGECQTEESDAV